VAGNDDLDGSAENDDRNDLVGALLQLGGGDALLVGAGCHSQLLQCVVPGSVDEPGKVARALATELLVELGPRADIVDVDAPAGELEVPAEDLGNLVVDRLRVVEVDRDPHRLELGCGADADVLAG